VRYFSGIGATFLCNLLPSAITPISENVSGYSPPLGKLAVANCVPGVSSAEYRLHDVVKGSRERELQFMLQFVVDVTC